MPKLAPLLALLALPALLPAQDRPNVLWLTVEDMSPWLACYGDATVPTPNLDRLASQSRRYSHAFASSPVCAPARSSLITGMWATRIGSMHMRTGNPSKTALQKNPEAYRDIPSYEAVPPAFVRCFPELLRRAGYYTSNNAKTDYQFKAPATVWDASGRRAHWRGRRRGQPFFAVFNHGGTHESAAFPERKPSKVFVTPAAVKVPPLYPDTPAVREALARSYNNIARMDAWVGKQLAELAAAGLDKNTWVFFFSDHGVGLPRGKRSPYDLGTRVPLLLRAPDGKGAGETVSRLLSFVDFGPTVLSLCGLQPDPRLDGRAFLGPAARPGRGYVFSHADRFDAVYDRARSVRSARYRYVRNYRTDLPHLIPNAYRERLPLMRDMAALRESGPRKPSQWQCASKQRPPEELYDCVKDPWELHNLIDSKVHQEALGRLRKRLDAWVKATGDLGLVLPEKRMVETRLWPDGEQPQTAKPEAKIEAGRMRLSCPTEGASLGYRRTKRSPWRVYTGPVQVRVGERIAVLAHRIGFRERRSVVRVE